MKVVQEACLMSVIADTTPDSTHNDRLTVCTLFINK